VAQDVRGQGRRAITLQADVADEAQVHAMFATLDRDFGPLAGLANNAGVVDRAPASWK
jgi:NAD(P)-dependent dehydrogenase (short-subunit alcohol dehydrogenase family)